MADTDKTDVKDKTIVLASDMLPDALSIIPLSHRPIFPGMMIPLILSGEELLSTISEIYDTDHKIGGAVLIEKFDEELTSDNMYKVGSVVKILKVTPADSKSIQVMLTVLGRFTQAEVLQETPIMHWRVIHHYEKKIEELSNEMKAYSMAIISSVKDLVALNPLFHEEFKLFLNRFSVGDPGKLADFVTAMTSADAKDAQNILETFDIHKRVEKVITLLKKEIELNKIQRKISQQIDEKMSAQQKEFFLREQLKAIKKELGLEKDEKSSEIEKFETRLSGLVLSDEAKTRINEELDKLRLLETQSAEYGVSRNYLEWLTTLPWGKFSKDNYDIGKAKKVLDHDHYGLDDIKERILEFISTGKMKGNITGSIILFVGPPGVGKTSIGKSVASALNRKFFRFSLGGMRDEAEIKGHRRTYIGAMPGKILQSLKTVAFANPVIMLDEIDKIGASFQGDPASALLEVLDPEQNVNFLDHYIDVRFDLSNILFIA
ncbi:MAG: LON peptidase substrate-binding domain-containing protein, partial [Spirochaetia bacterium]|nr:LON peptidase substrate-binding domain-containing protein [Spirochaetia bacterium]